MGMTGFGVVDLSAMARSPGWVSFVCPWDQPSTLLKDVVCKYTNKLLLIIGFHPAQTQILAHSGSVRTLAKTISKALFQSVGFPLSLTNQRRSMNHYQA